MTYSFIKKLDKKTCGNCDNLRIGECEYGGLEYWCKLTYKHVYENKKSCDKWNIKTKDKIN